MFFVGVDGKFYLVQNRCGDTGGANTRSKERKIWKVIFFSSHKSLFD